MQQCCGKEQSISWYLQPLQLLVCLCSMAALRVCLHVWKHMCACVGACVCVDGCVCVLPCKIRSSMVCSPALHRKSHTGRGGQGQDTACAYTHSFLYTHAHTHESPQVPQTSLFWFLNERPVLSSTSLKSCNSTEQLAMFTSMLLDFAHFRLSL